MRLVNISELSLAIILTSLLLTKLSGFAVLWAQVISLLLENLRKLGLELG